MIFSIAFAEEPSQEEAEEEENIVEVEGEAGFDLGRDSPIVRDRISVARKVIDHVYLGVFSQYESPDQILGAIGPTFTLKGFELTAAVGLQKSDLPFLGLSRLVFKHKYLDVDLIATFGQEEIWYEGAILGKLGPVGLGPYIQKEDGFGPRLTVTFGEFTAIVTAPTYSSETKGLSLIAGLKWQPKY